MCIPYGGYWIFTAITWLGHLQVGQIQPNAQGLHSASPPDLKKRLNREGTCLLGLRCSSCSAQHIATGPFDSVMRKIVDK
jgi:hypothetical protein